MTGLADTFPYVGPVTGPSFPIVVSNTAPANPTTGSAWLDTSKVPPVLSVYDGAVWIGSSSASTATTTGLPPATAADQTLGSSGPGQTWAPTTMDGGRY
jgi:hypothetical protein